MRTFAVLAVLLSVPNAALADSERRCTRAKLRAAAEYVRAYYDCHADGAAAGGDAEVACLVAASDAVKARVAAADARGPCPGTPDRIANAICVPPIEAGDAACRTAKYRATGWKFARRLVCHGNGLRKGEAPRSGCFDRVEARFTRRIARADAAGSCDGSAMSLEAIVDRCVLAMATALSCGNDRLDYGELCEGVSDFCNAPACYPLVGECCVTAAGCFQFGGPIEQCFFDGGIDVRQGICTPSGCVDDIPISPAPVCCQQTGGGCSDDVADTANELAALAGSCGPNTIAVVGTCGTDGRCVAASESPVALTTTSTAPPATTTSTTSMPGATTTTTTPFPICTNIGGACGSCGNGTCAQPIAGIEIGACVASDSAGPCSGTPQPCGEWQICVGSVDECHDLCF